MMDNFIRFQICLLSLTAFKMIEAQGFGPSSVGGIGAQCDGVIKLCPADADCSDQVCKCKDGFAPDRSQRNCIEQTREWEGPCSENNQCQIFEGAICKGNICDCPTGHHYLPSKCWTTRLLNEECADDNECYLSIHADRIECSDGKCNCKNGYFITDTGDDCSGASELWKVGFPTLLVISIIKSLLL